MSYTKVKALSTIVGAYGKAHAGDIVTVRDKDAKQLEASGLVEIVGEGEKQTVAPSGSVRIADLTISGEAAETETDESNPTGVKPMTAAELIEKIKGAESQDAIEEIIAEGESRKTVLEAAEKRKAELGK